MNEEWRWALNFDIEDNDEKTTVEDECEGVVEKKMVRDANTWMEG